MSWAQTAVATLVVLMVWAHAADGKQGYNLWAKERIKNLIDRTKREPDNAHLHVMISKAYFEDGELRKAEAHLRLALEMEPDYTEAHCNLAVMLHAQRRLSGALHHYEAALAADSTMGAAMAGLGTLLCSTNRQSQGIDYLEQVLALAPSRLKARFNLAVAYHQVDDFAKSIAHLLVLLSEQPGYPGGRNALAQAHFSRGLILLNAEQPVKALEFFSKALEGKEDDDFHFATGIAYLRIGDMDAAERAFSSAVELNQEHVPALHNLATVYELTQRAEKAWYYYDRVRALAPHLDTIEAVRSATYDEAYLME